MAAASSSPSSSQSRITPSSFPLNELSKQIRHHEVAIGELNSLPSSRPVYVKNGDIFFRTTIQKAITSEQRQLDLAKSKLQKTDKE